MKMNLKGCYLVKPAEQTPNITICLSESDQIKPIPNFPTIYFYNKPTIPNFSFESAVETLKTSLSKVLVHFYPLAGRLRWVDDKNGGPLELECNSMGAQIYVYESDKEMADYGDMRPTFEVAKQLIPSMDWNTTPIHELPLFLAQLTKFGCGGMSLGLAISHVATDGAGALHLISEWARNARGEPLSRSPVFQDPTLNTWQVAPRPPRFDHPEYKRLPLLIDQSDYEEERKKETILEVLVLTKFQVERLKSLANGNNKNDAIRIGNGIYTAATGNGKGNGNNSRPYSTYEVVTGHIWKCACKARKLKNEQLTSARIAIDARNRLRPPLPQGYFGNAIFPVLATGRVEDIVGQSLSYASSKIRKTMEKVNDGDEYIRSAIDFIKTQYDDLSGVGFRSFPTCFGNPNIEVTSWIGLPLYNADFGWGKEIYMGPGSIAYDGKCYIMTSPHKNGSLIVTLRLQVAHMNSFKKFFYEDIEIQG